MFKIDLIHQISNDPASDFLAEVIASSLIEQGHDPEKVIIIREGASKRGYSPCPVGFAISHGRKILNISKNALFVAISWIYSI